MKNTKLIWILTFSTFILIVASSINALTTSDTNFISAWNESDGSGNLADYFSRNQLNKTNNPLYYNNASCVNNGCVAVNGTGSAGTNYNTFLTGVISGINNGGDFWLDWYGTFPSFTSGYWTGPAIGPDGTNYIAFQTQGVGVNQVNTIVNGAAMGVFNVSTSIQHYAIVSQESSATDYVLIYAGCTLVQNFTVSGTHANTRLNLMGVLGGSFGNPNWAVNDEIILLNRTATQEDINQRCAMLPSSYLPFPTSNPSITFTGQTPSNATVQYITSNSFTVNTTAAVFGGTVNTTHFLYNTSGSLLQSNSANQANYTSTFSSLSAGTYYFNATASNGTTTNFTETRIIYIYSLTTGSITSPANNSEVANRYVNFTWTNATINPTASGVRVNNFSLAIYNSDATTFNVSIGATSQLNITNFDIFALNLDSGIYWIHLTSQDSQGNTVITQNRVNLTRNAILNITVKDARNNTILTNGSILITDLTAGSSGLFNTTNGNLIIPIVKTRTYNLFSDFAGYSYGTINYTANSSNSQFLNITLYTNNSVNISIFDESSGALILQTVAISFNGPTSYSYSTNTSFLYVDNIRDGTYTVTFSSTGYSLKSYTITVNNRSFQNLNAFLSANSTAVTFTFLDFDSSAVLQGVSFTQFRLINGTNTTVDSKTSDITGRAQVYAVSGVSYDFVASLSGYSTEVFTLNPVIFSSYNVRLHRITAFTPTNTPDYTGVSVTFYNTSFYANATQSVVWIISSPVGALLNYSYNITYPGGVSLHSGTNAIGQQFSDSFTLGNTNLSDRVIISYCYQSTTSYNKCFSYPYPIIGSYGNFTMLANKDRTYGMGLFDRVLIATIFTLAVAGAVYKFGGGPITGIPIALIMLGYFVKIGFIPLWAVLPSMLIGVVLIWRGE